MPRKKLPPKFKYTVRKGDALYVKYPLPGLKNHVWRRCREETQDAVDGIIEEIKNDCSRTISASIIPESADDFFKFWLMSVKNRISERTFQGYEAVIRRYLEPNLGHLPIAEIKAKHLETLYRKMSDGGLQPVTVRKSHAVLSSIFREAVKHEIVSSNPAQIAKPPKTRATLKIKTMSLEEVRRFLLACQDLPHGVIFEFALETGLRPQEYLALRWTDIDLEKGAVEVVRALVYDRKGGGYYFKEPKTRKSRRTVPLSVQMCEKLRKHKENQDSYLREVASRITRRCKPSRETRREYNKNVLKNHSELNLVFASLESTPFKDINLGRRYFKAIAKKAGLSEDLSLYCLRHSSISLMIAAGVNVKVVSERAGHSNISTTLQIYTHVLSGQQEEATEKISKILYQ